MLTKKTHVKPLANISRYCEVEKCVLYVIFNPKHLVFGF